MNKDIYLDANATCEVLPQAIRAATDMLEERFGNPSSSHMTGLRARAVLDDTRRRAQRVLGVGSGRLLFTSGATEGIQTAVLSVLCAVRERQLAGRPCGALLVYGATEHKAVPESLAHWNRILGTGLELVALPVDADGRHRLDVLRELAPRAAMVCTMAANNETGVVSDLWGIEAVLRESGSEALWMVDCVQALGKLNLSLADSRIDYAPFSGHKLCAPKGIGMLYVRPGAPFTPLMAGGGQEAGQRSGTENMAGIAALGAVLAALEEGNVFRGHGELDAWRGRLAAALRDAFPGIVFNAPFEHALPTTINFSVPGLSSRDLLDLFDAAGVRVSAGSACSAAKAAPSYVLLAMGLTEERAASAVRMSFGPQVDEDFIDEACRRIASCGRALRTASLSPLAGAEEGGVGLYQLSAEGRCGWLLFDAEEASCVAVDPPAPLVPRLAALVRSNGYHLRAVVGTGADPMSCHAHVALGAALGELPGSDDPAWPWAGDSVKLGDGATVPCLRIGAAVLAKLVDGERASYLLGVPHDGELPASAVRYAFTGNAPAPGCAEGMGAARLREAVQRLAMIVNAGTLLCGACDEHGIPCGTTTALAQGRGELAELLAAQPLLARRAPPGMGSVADLAPHALERFLQTHPDAILVDVREAAEHAAGHAPLHGREVLSVPLTRLAEHAAHWLRADPKPLVLFCRSGNRSARAVQCLHRLGYPQAWHVVGGLALAN